MYVHMYISHVYITCIYHMYISRDTYMYIYMQKTNFLIFDFVYII